MGFQTWPEEGGGGSPSWGAPVNTPGNLPASGNINGTLRVVLSTYDEYLWNGTSWVLYYSPLPNFTSKRLLYGNGSKVPAVSADLEWDNVTKILSVGASSASSNGRVIVGGSGTGIGQIDGGGGALNIIGGPLTVSTNNPTDAMSFRPGGTEMLRLDNNAFRATFFGNVQHNLLTASRALYVDGSKNVSASSTTDVELGRLSGVTSPVQTQLNGKLNLSGGTMTGSLNLAVAIPTQSFEAAAKGYVDMVAQGLDAKPSSQAATTGNITLSGLQTIDGVVLVDGDRVLVKSQTDNAQNGIYTAAAGSWIRAIDFDTWAEVPGGFTFVEEGTVNGATGWVCISAVAGTIEVSPILFTQFSGAGTYRTDGNGLEMIGTIFFLELDGGTLFKSAAGLKVANNSLSDAQIAPAAGIGRSKIEPQTIDRAIVSDGAGKMIASLASAQEVEYLVGLSGNIQPQFDAIYAAKTLVTVTTNLALVNKSINLVNTGAARSVTLPAPTLDGYLIVKDKSGLADVNNITVLRSSGGVKIEGVASNLVINTSWSSHTFVSDGIDWFIV